MAVPRKWLMQRLRRALGMWQMVEQSSFTDRGCSEASPGSLSSLSYFTPFSRMLATCTRRTARSTGTVREAQASSKQLYAILHSYLII